MNLPEIAEVWRRGSVIGSWLLDLTAGALRADPELAAYGGRVSDSGEGRWTLEAAIEEGVPAHVLSAALYERFASRGERRLRQPGALGDATRVRRPYREAGGGKDVSDPAPQAGGSDASRRAPPSDALVVFGFSGDLAFKLIFPALYPMVKKGDADGAGDRRRLVAPERRAGAPARAREHRAQPAASTTRRRSTGCSRCCATSAATTASRRPSRR